MILKVKQGVGAEVWVKTTTFVGSASYRIEWPGGGERSTGFENERQAREHALMSVASYVQRGHIPPARGGAL